MFFRVMKCFFRKIKTFTFDDIIDPAGKKNGQLSRLIPRLGQLKIHRKRML